MAYRTIKSPGGHEKFYGIFKKATTWWITFIIMWIILFNGYIFVKYDFELPSLIDVAYAALIKFVWTLLTCVLILVFTQKNISV